MQNRAWTVDSLILLAEMSFNSAQNRKVRKNKDTFHVARAT